VIQPNPITEEPATVEENGIRLHLLLHVQKVSRCRLDVAGAYSAASCRRYTCP
jgi:hypothetical protein